MGSNPIAGKFSGQCQRQSRNKMSHGFDVIVHGGSAVLGHYLRSVR
jgi:hypothetical protein